MLPFITILNKTFPSYGLMIVLGIIIANIFALRLVRLHSLNPDYLILGEAFGFLGGAVGAKLLYLIISYKSIDWSRITDLHYLNELMQGGFVFYGGLIGGLLFIFLGCTMEKIPLNIYLRTFIFMIPLMHGFGRIGCFMAGCCYGIPYKGFLSVVYPRESLAPSGIELFPVQILEAFLLIILAMWLYHKAAVNQEYPTIELYLISYGIIRFILEYLRYDSARGRFHMLSTSQWISIFLVIAGFILYRNYSGNIRK